MHCRCISNCSLPKTTDVFLRPFECISRDRSRSLEFGSTPSRLFSLRVVFERSKLESIHDISVTRIGDTLSYGFAQTDCIVNAKSTKLQFSLVRYIDFCNNCGAHFVCSKRCFPNNIEPVDGQNQFMSLLYK